MTDSKLFVPIIVGSIREGRNTPRLGRFLHAKLEADERVDTQLLDLRDYDLPLMKERLRFLENPPEALVAFAEPIARCDALMIVSPEYNKGYPGVLKNAIDYLGPEYKRKPIGIATHSVGFMGGAVCLQALRAVMLNLGAVPIPAGMNVPHINKAFDEEGKALDDAYHDRAERFIDELVWYAEALKRQRELA